MLLSSTHSQELRNILAEQIPDFADYDEEVIGIAIMRFILAINLKDDQR